MKDAFVLVVTSILFFACTGPTIAQEIELIPELKGWEPVLGKWQSEFEERESPTGDWKKRSETYEIRSGGFYVEIRGTGDVGGEEISWIEIVGYDPVKGTQVSSFFDSGGTMGRVTSQDWSGTTLTLNFTNFTREREVQVRRNTWEHSSDFKSVTGTWEQFTDGKWWVAGKAQNTKVE